MPALPRHPITGVEAIAVLPTGRIVWPISGGADGDDKPKPGTGDDDKKPDDDPSPDKDDGKDTAAEVAKWKALARKHEDQAKANVAAAKRLKELEDADKSALEVANEKLAEAERRAAESEARVIRAEVAASKGLTLAMAKRLVGATREEIEADADELLTELKGADSTASNGKGGDDTSRRPTEKLRPGAAPQAEAEDNDPSKLAAQVPRY